MKTYTIFAASALVAMVSIDCATAYPKFLEEIPNGSLFEKSLGHADSKYTDFGKAFSEVGTWTNDFCKAFYPGTSIPNGKAFGDPCCTWKKGAKADKTVTAWTDKPTIATECANSAPSVTPAPAATTAAPSPGGNPTTAPAATTVAPSPGGKPTTAPASTTVAPSPGGKPTTAPADKPTTAPSGGDGKPSGKPSKCKVKPEQKSLEEDDEATDEEEY